MSLTDPGDMCVQYYTMCVCQARGHHSVYKNVREPLLVLPVVTSPILFSIAKFRLLLITVNRATIPTTTQSITI